MKNKKFIRELKQGDKIQGTFIIVKARQCISKNGPYWDMELQDKTGRIPAKLWHPASLEYESIEENSFVYLHGEVDSFRENLQIRITKLKFLKEDEIDIEELLPSTKVPPSELLEELEDLCFRTLKYKPLKRLVGMILKDKYIRDRLLKTPAAKSIHHAYMGGLLEHTLNVCKLCMEISKLYPDVDKEVILAAAVLHDIGKIEELNGTISPDYSDSGQLIGHVVLSLSIIEPFLKKVKELDREIELHLKHIILSHHGEYEFGSPKRPKTREALIVHFADNIDAKLNAVTTLIDGMEETQETWSKFQRFLDRKIYRPVNTRELVQDKKEQKKRSIEKCLLPLKG